MLLFQGRINSEQIESAPEMLRELSKEARPSVKIPQLRIHSGSPLATAARTAAISSSRVAKLAGSMGS